MVDGVNLTISNLSFVGGKSQEGGTFFVSGGGSLNLHSAQIFDSRAAVIGGAIFAGYGGDVLHVENSLDVVHVENSRLGGLGRDPEGILQSSSRTRRNNGKKRHL